VSVLVKDQGLQLFHSNIPNVIDRPSFLALFKSSIHSIQASNQPSSSVHSGLGSVLPCPLASYLVRNSVMSLIATYYP